MITPKIYNFADRTLAFAQETRKLIRLLPRITPIIEDVRQLTRSSGSIGANYLEACEALSKKDFIKHLKIARKEARETIYWFKLLDLPETTLTSKRDALLTETQELLNILSSIIAKSEKDNK